MKTKRGDDVEEVSEERPSKSQRVSDTLTSVDLPRLLDFLSLTSLEHISARFDAIANTLLHECCINLFSAGVETEFDILELECYLQKDGYHEDPFTHGSDEQKHSGRWYFHRAPTRSSTSHASPTAGGGYRGGTRKGLDLTLGCPNINSDYFPNSSAILRGGILLRSVRRISDLKVISGPSLLVDEILRLSGASNISDLVALKWDGNTTAFPPSSPTKHPTPSSMYLVRKISTAKSEPPHVYRSPRVGLDLSHSETTNSPTHPRVVFVSKPYRYFVHPHLLTANGRGHTFLGVYRACVESGTYGEDGEDVESLRKELTRLTGIKDATVIKYLADYKAGLSGGKLRAFIGVGGKGAGSSPSMFLKMMGTLERLDCI